MISRVVSFCDRCEDDVVATETIEFDSDGTTVELDVCPTHHGEWQDMERQRREWAKAGREKKGSARRRRQPPAEPPTSTGVESTGVQVTRHRKANPQSVAIREWALANGYEINGRGRLPAEVVAAFSRSRWSSAAEDHPDDPDQHPEASSASDPPPATQALPTPSAVAGRLASANPQLPPPRPRRTAHG